MEGRSFLFLKRLVETPSPSGFERPLQKVVREEIEKVADKVKTDVHGNVIAVKNGKVYRREGICVFFLYWWS